MASLTDTDGQLSTDFNALLVTDTDGQLSTDLNENILQLTPEGDIIVEKPLLSLLETCDLQVNSGTKIADIATQIQFSLLRSLDKSAKSMMEAAQLRIQELLDTHIKRVVGKSSGERPIQRNTLALVLARLQSVPLRREEIISYRHLFVVERNSVRLEIHDKNPKEARFLTLDKFVALSGHSTSLGNDLLAPFGWQIEESALLTIAPEVRLILQLMPVKEVKEIE